MTIAWVFPGQGSQKVGMAEGVLNLPHAKSRFEYASDLLGRNILEICRGEASHEISDLNDTRNTQPALFIIESLLVDDLKRQGRKASFFAGHSLGEIVALYAADVINFETSLKLLQKRSELMAASENGSMTAIIGFDRDKLTELVESQKDVVIANDNSESQVVLSGTADSIQNVLTSLKCKRAIPLAVSGAFHSPLMSKASDLFSQELSNVNFKDAEFPVLSNFDPEPCTNGGDLKEKLSKQMTNGVRWRETMDILISRGVNTFVEIGPGNVLSGLLKRSFKNIGINQISTSEDLGH